MAVNVIVQLPATAHGPAGRDRHLAARVDEPPGVLRLADVLHGDLPDGAEELWHRHPGCAVLAVAGPDGAVRVRVRGRGAPLRVRVPGLGPDEAAALAGSLVHALLVAGCPAVR